MKTRRPTLVAAAVLGVAALVAVPWLAGPRLVPAVDGLSDASRGWLGLALAGFGAAFICSVGAWRTAFIAAGADIEPTETAARIGIGALVNAVAPARLGDAVKVALCSRAIDSPGRMWTGGGVYAALEGARSIALASLLIVASVTGAIPLWPVFVLFALAGLLVVAARASRRVRNHARIQKLLAGISALASSPRAAATVVGWSLAVQVTRLLATVAVARALDLPHPVLAALVILPALDLAGAFPITPGGVGVGSGAVAVALASRGIGMTEALGVGLAMQALETTISLFAGSFGAVYLTRAHARIPRYALSAAAYGATATVAAALGVAVVSVT
ncbi:MAG TPA: lysylphosphatidylglycerol synthase domain-containing protein [Gaiellaceae bacterium]